ncbi:dipeptidylpeptidase 8 [Tieghemostelium lacteum]|uniref:Dipeptidylpeptidase 8 n=1 Tax=Tieghemostelium lacteum TaxID=361077 RepID=A0A152A3Y9_TIELA|nr:dipeptidylpeptidase 8 [Tieghemostelium lacteum]|eukprot:KYR00983.1 dipeptidylpeptidase 8 [Tieghemostelium lacteum]
MYSLIKRVEAIEKECVDVKDKNKQLQQDGNCGKFTLLRRKIGIDIKQVKDLIKERDKSEEDMPGTQRTIQLSYSIRNKIKEVKDDTTKLERMHLKSQERYKRKNKENTEKVKVLELHGEEVQLAFAHVKELEIKDKQRGGEASLFIPLSSSPGSANTIKYLPDIDRDDFRELHKNDQIIDEVLGRISDGLKVTENIANEMNKTATKQGVMMDTMTTKTDKLEIRLETMNGNESFKNPNSFQLDENYLFFLCNQKENNQLTIHYIDLSSDNKEIKVLLNNATMNTDDLSLEAKLQRERQRIVTSGITSFQYNSTTKIFLVDINSKINLIDISKSIEKPILKEVTGDTYNMSISSDQKVVAYVKDSNLWLTDIESDKQHQLTHVSGKFLTCGDAKFVYQEEFSRYTGYWFNNSSTLANTTTTTNSRIYQILYIEEDESQVMDYSIPDSGIKGEVSHYKYPLAGEKNTKITLKALEFSIENSKLFIQREKTLDLQKLFPWCEYLVRAGWLPNNNSIWIQLLDRAQQKLQLVRLDPFGSNDQQPTILFQELSETWVNVVDAIHFCKNTPQLVITSEALGYRHLYLVTATDNSFSSVDSCRNLTGGNWVVKGDRIWLCEEKKLISFVANLDSPIQNHLYQISYNVDLNSSNNQTTQTPKRLTVASHYHSQISVSADQKRFVSLYSNTNTPYKVECYQWSDNEQNYQLLHTLPNLNPSNIQYSMDRISLDQTDQNKAFYQQLANSKREIFTFQNSQGYKIFGKVFFPANYDSTKQYPTVLSIYGGPHVQYVTDQYQLMKHYHTLFGFVVVVIDNMGSDNRGVDFESKLKWKMGTVELNDYVEGLEYLISQKLVNIDRNRIAISGWSYGGYLALHAIGQRPDFFKIAISGAPVSLWEAYNTGYTERYMSTPQLNPEGYKKANSLTYIQNFPNQENRLIVIHGLADENVHFSNTSVLIEELTNHQKPYILKILTKERHSVRNINNRVYIEAHNLNHLLKHL